MDHGERVAQSSTAWDPAEPPSPTVNVELKRKVDPTLPNLQWLADSRVQISSNYGGVVVVECRLRNWKD